jgi:23S rRNA maturation mini-RNase III
MPTLHEGQSTAVKRGRGAHAAQHEERSMKVFVTTQDVATRRSEIVGEMTLEEFAARVQEVVQATGHKISHEGVARVLRAAET